MKFLRLVGFVFGGMLISVVFAVSAHAATFTVTSTADDSAVTPATGCATVLPDCTLRSSIEAANAQAGADIINFNIAGAGVHTISPASDFPTIDEQTTIDGTTQPGATCGTLVPSSLPGTNTTHNLLIEINGSGSSIHTLVFGSTATSSVVRGLVMNNAPSGYGSIGLVGVDSMTIECNYFGTDPTGTIAQTATNSYGVTGFGPALVIQNNLLSGYSGTNGAGVQVGGDAKNINNNLVGTDASGTSSLSNGIGIWDNDTQSQPTATVIHHNIVSGNSGVGIQDGQLTYGGGNITVTGNYIGLNITGNPLGNGGDGIFTIGASNFVIGGTTAADRNYIAANGGNGLHIYSEQDNNGNCNSSSSSQVYGNYIGTNTSGAVSVGFGNQQSGIAVNELEQNCSHGTSYNHIIGGDSSGQSNIIAGNTLDGIRVYQVPNSSTDVFSIAMLPNTIFGNGNLGMNLAADSTGSGTADTDLGPNVINNFLMSYPATNANYYINRPTVNSATFLGNQVTVNYSYQANGVQDNLPFISAADVVGFRFDFYLNDNAQDGAYAGYNQGKNHLGSFIIDNNSVSNATHTFTSPITPTANQTVNCTATVLWTTSPGGNRNGTSPPYQNND